MSTREQAKARKNCRVQWFGSRSPAVFEPSAVERSGLLRAEYMTDNDGVERVSSEIVELVVYWNRRDQDIIDSFKEWLDQQRENNPNAKCFKKKGGWNKMSPYSALVYLAMVRADRAGFDQEKAERALRKLAEVAGCPSRLDQKRYSEELAIGKRLFDEGKMPKPKPGRKRPLKSMPS